MPVKFNRKSYSRIRSLIQNGQVNRTAKWAKPDHPKLLDCLAYHSELSPDSPSYLAYPAVKSGRVYRSALIAAKQRASQQGASKIASAADKLLKIVDKDQFSYEYTGDALILNADVGTPSHVLNDMPREINGEPVSYLWKEVLPVGHYKDSAGRDFSVTPERVDNLIANFKRAYAKGLKPYIPDSHDHAEGSRNYGFIVNARKNAKGSLELLHQLIGDDARRFASRNGTSVKIVKGVTDATGEKYDELLIHNAIVPNPRLTGLGGFQQAIAASQGDNDNAVVLQWAANQGDTDMNLIEKFRKMFGKPDMTEEEVVAKAQALVEGVKDTSLSDDHKPEPKQPDNKAIEMASGFRASIAKLRGEKNRIVLSKLLERGSISAAFSQAFDKEFIEPAINGTSLTLSQTITGTDETVVDRFLALLDGNKPVTMSEQTDVQGQPRTVPGMPENDMEKIAKAGEQQAASYIEQQLKARGIK